ncbi:MAG: hypothetical protein J6Y32_01030 [Bacteroidales bacterium]|nr:hypothetical protein [Bacteroidales bacterium]
MRLYFPLPLLVILLLLASCSRNYAYDPELESALTELDRTLDQEEALAAAKMARIDSIRSKLALEQQPLARYRIYAALAEEFIKWDPDSTLLYAHQKERLARQMNDPVLINDAILTLARRYMISGMYHEALSMVQNLDRKIAQENGQLQECEFITYRIYHGLVAATPDEVINQPYREKETEYMNRCKKVLTKDRLEYYTTRAGDLVEGGSRDYEQAREMMEKLLEEPGLPMETRSYYHYWLARACQAIGDERTAMLHYALGARLDYLTPQREYSSAIRLSKLCYYSGDLDRAYRYITRSYNDSHRAKARLRMNQLSPLLPLIIKDYEKQSKSNLTNTHLFIAALLVILAALAIALLLVFRSRRNLRKAHREITRKTRALEDSNQIKDAYITEFLQMFSEHVDSLDRYRNELKKSTEKKDINALIKQLNSDKFIDAEWDYLFLKFDQTFLGIFPDFVEKLNTLLRKDSYQVGANLYPGRLNNELRTYALIRLGVTDSTRIAKFLHLSISTVYNNRVRLRNAARNREHFEELVMKL